MIRLLLLLLLFPCALHAQEWPVWGGNPEGTRYSALDQVNADNVDDLEIAWQIRTGSLDKYGVELSKTVGFQANPILTPPAAGRSLVLCTPFNEVLALDPATGEVRWSFDPHIDLGGNGSDADPDGENATAFLKCRGVAFWQDDQSTDNAAACTSRILLATNDLRLFALDARTGELCKGFGKDGEVDAEPFYMDKKPVWKHEVRFYNPPVVAGDLMILTTKVRDNHRWNAPAGTLRAFSVRTGALVWQWDPVPRDANDPMHKIWDKDAARETGGGQAWGMLSVDEERDLLFLPTSSPSPDFYGGTRPGNNEYADSIVALRASTGEYVWHFQTVHHNVWDYDNAAQPVLIDLVKNNKPFPAVIQATKTGMLYIFHRETGEPFFAIEERPVPTNGVAGEQLSPTQPFPVAPPPLVPHDFDWDDEWWLTFGACKEFFADARIGPIFTPPSLEGTVVVPSTAGGVNWGSVAIHEPSNTLVTNVLNMPHFAQLVPNSEVTEPRPDAGPNDMNSLNPMHGTPYHLRQGPFMSPRFLPCSKPPWAMVVAVDLQKGTIKWEAPLGTADKLSPIPIPFKWGTPTFSGGIVTAGGLFFIGATVDNRFRAFDIKDGDELWTVKLPTSSFAHPMTYSIDGKQYVVIVTGGHPFIDQDPGDWVTAFALPEGQ
ncbi:MAG: pyrroloquinoline quinone-dependent dehydrogenase [Gammaproteobacteria bacterium]|jgi:quinoprotein glucose dehydrogenase|nr:pyrroloquinoline quinone-dependent dehydrogenase [Gammaproteobacteria bacterium]MDP6616245.1 pyrroloquinoline quinone-dependent dehydrogenase [Gammaproteobacteria bacterium]MDP6695448.1 pyrroloquinoline quinone-dependent dehydrogenase [Gammaproteobacteria bacterium]